MAKSRVPSPQESIKIRRLPVRKGDQIMVKATVTRVDPENGKVTISVPGALAPITAPAGFWLPDSDA